MKNHTIKVGDIRTIKHIVTKYDAAVFESKMVHPVYGTFALGRDAEWACRQFVLEMKEDNEEGIGTFLNIQHISPALIGEEVIISAEVESLEGNSIICKYKVQIGDRTIATGTQGQKILPKERIKKIFDGIK